MNRQHADSNGTSPALNAFGLPRRHALVLALGVALLVTAPGCKEQQRMTGAMTTEQAPEHVRNQPVPAEQTENSAQQSAAATASDKAPSGQSPAPAPIGAANVEVLPVVPRDFAVETVYIGNLTPNERVELRTEIEGVVEKLMFEEGEPIRKNEILANIATKQLQIRRDLAHSDFQLAESNLRRAKDLMAKKLIPSSRLEETQNRRDVSYYALKLAQIELDKSQVESPINGVVKTKAVSQGEFLNKGQLIAEILDIGKVKALVNVPEGDIRHLTPGKNVSVTLDALPGQTFPGQVKTVGLEADTRSRSFPVEIEMDNSDGHLLPGMLARVKIQLAAYHRQVLVPQYAVLERETGRVVFVARNGRAEERPVELGASTHGQVQVLKGLKFNDRLIVVGQQKLSHGEPIVVQREQPSN